MGGEESKPTTPPTTVESQGGVHFLNVSLHTSTTVGILTVILILGAISLAIYYLMRSIGIKCRKRPRRPEHEFARELKRAQESSVLQALRSYVGINSHTDIPTGIQFSGPHGNHLSYLQPLAPIHQPTYQPFIRSFDNGTIDRRIRELPREVPRPRPSALLAPAASPEDSIYEEVDERKVRPRKDDDDGVHYANISPAPKTRRPNESGHFHPTDPYP